MQFLPLEADGVYLAAISARQWQLPLWKRRLTKAQCGLRTIRATPTLLAFKGLTRQRG
jgi:hypothetical protein